MRNLTLITLATAGFSYAAVVFAVGNTESTLVKKIDLESVPLTNESELKRFVLNPSEPLSNKLLDYAWQNRENIDNQKMIASYLVRKPNIPKNYDVAWKTARLVYFIGNYGYGEKEFLDTESGAQLFYYGIAAAQKATELNGKGIEGYYWYAYCQSAYGRAKSVLAMAANANDAMPALRKAIELNPSYGNYGAERMLGFYYQEIPVIFGGSEDKALELIKSAVAKAPQDRSNWVALGQYYNHFGYYESGGQACKKALNVANIDGEFEELRYMREAKECVDKAKSREMSN